MSIRESIGGVAKLLVNVHDADLKAELQAALLNAQGEALELQEQVARFQEETAKLREQLRGKNKADELAEQLYYARHAYWRKNEPNGPAYCPTCWPAKNLLVPLAQDSKHGRCRVCETNHWHVYDGPRPKEGDPATYHQPPDPPVLGRTRSRRDQMLDY